MFHYKSLKIIIRMQSNTTLTICSKRVASDTNTNPLPPKRRRTTVVFERPPAELTTISPTVCPNRNANTLKINSISLPSEKYDVDQIKRSFDDKFDEIHSIYLGFHIAWVKQLGETIIKLQDDAGKCTHNHVRHERCHTCETLSELTNLRHHCNTSMRKINLEARDITCKISKMSSKVALLKLLEDQPTE